MTSVVDTDGTITGTAAAVSDVTGVTGMRTHLVGQFHVGANQWRTGGLDPRAARTTSASIV